LGKGSSGGNLTERGFDPANDDRSGRKGRWWDSDRKGRKLDKKTNNVWQRSGYLSGRKR